MHTSFIDNFESIRSLCLIESQGSFVHEVINLAIVEDVLKRGTFLTLVGSQAFIDYYADLLSYFCKTTIISSPNYVVIKEPKSCWGISQLIFELKALLRARTVRKRFSSLLVHTFQ